MPKSTTHITSTACHGFNSLWMNLDGSEITMLGILVLANHLCQYNLLPMKEWQPTTYSPCISSDPPEPQLCPTLATTPPAAKTPGRGDVPLCRRHVIKVPRCWAPPLKNMLPLWHVEAWKTWEHQDDWRYGRIYVPYGVECNNGIFAAPFMFTVNMYRRGILVIRIGQIIVMQSESIPAILDVGGSLAIWFRCTTGLDIWM